MDRLISKTWISSLIVMLIIIGIAFFTFYYPMNKELQRTYINNFQLLSESKFDSIYNFIDRSLEGSRSLSSRSWIRNKIISYKNGHIEIEELKRATEQRYKTGVRALRNVTSALRIVDGEIIAKYGDFDYGNINRSKYDSQLSYDIDTENREVKLIVYSPIKSNHEVLGYDIVTFDLDKYIKNLEDEKVQVDILQEEIDDVFLWEQEDYIGYIFRNSEMGKAIYIYTSKTLLYKPLKRISIITGLSFIISLTLLYIGIRYIIIKNTNKILLELKINRDEYREQAYKDALTGVRSRTFLESWIDTNFLRLEDRDKEYCIAMIDVDKFKSVNDKYGHNTGDKVLKKIGEIIKLSLRESDIVIRYGGDEFLVIFEDCNQEMASSILMRVEEKIRNIDDFNFKVDISYGVATVENNNDFLKSIDKADKRMYRSKKDKYKVFNS